MSTTQFRGWAAARTPGKLEHVLDTPAPPRRRDAAARLAEVRLGARITGRWAATGALALAGDPLARLVHRPWRDDPYPTYASLRDRPQPVPSRAGLVLVSRTDLAEGLLRDRRFHVKTSEGGFPGGPREGRDPLVNPVDVSFLVMDPPDHTRLRRLAQVAFTPARVAGYRELAERTATRLVDDAVRRGRFDLAADVAAPLPITVIADVLGIPEEATARFRAWGATLATAINGVRSVRAARAVAAATGELRALLGGLLVQRREHPGDDLISVLGASDADADELVGVAQLLLFAGFETTSSLIGTATVAMLEARTPWEALCAAPRDVAPRAVEEGLRFEAPVQFTARVPHADVEVGGCSFRADVPVIILLGAAHRDPAVHDDPDVFDLDRPTVGRHLAFSAGIHYCLGAPLARLEAEVALAALASRAPGLRLDGRPIRVASPILRGFRSIPVRCAHVSTNRAYHPE